MIVAGVDEVGRGALFGPLVAAAVAYEEGCVPQGVKDSKVLSQRKRESLYGEILHSAKDVSVSMATSFRIDEINVHNADKGALREALLGLRVPVERAFVDGFPLEDLPFPHEAVIHGDASIPVISAASIVAKVLRDHLMALLSVHFPLYGLDVNKGYGTTSHREAVKTHGPTLFHRTSFHIKSLGEKL